MNKVIAVDFETFYIDKEYSIKIQGNDGYLSDARFDPYLIAVCDGTQTWAGQINQFNWNALDGNTLVSHNRRFDESCKLEMDKRGWSPVTSHTAWHCTASLTTYLAMRRDLARATEFLLGEQVDKSYRVDADGKHWADMVREGVAEKVKAAGRVDAVRCYQFWAKFSHLWPERERQISDLTIRQGRRGVQIDTEKLDRFLIYAQTALIQAEADLPWMKEGKKPTSPKAIAEECRKVGIPCPPVKSRDGEDKYDEWAAAFARYPWVKAYTDFRVIHKLIGILETIKERLKEGGIFPFDLLYFGAHTGRWAGGGGYNMQNMRKDAYYFDVFGRMITDEKILKDIESHYAKLADADVPIQDRTPPEYVSMVIDIRSLFTHRPGKKMIISDLSQIEPRCLAWAVNDRPMLEKMAAGQGPYEAHARSTMGWTGGEMKKENKKGYALAKARILGLGYQCGWKKFIVVAQNMAGLDITVDDPKEVQVVNREGELCFEPDATGNLVPKMESGYGYNSKRIVKEYRESNPLIASQDDQNPGIWRKLQNAFEASVGGDFVITLPSGRQLRYPQVQRECKSVADPDDPKKWKRKWVTTALAFDQRRNAVIRQPFYGGLLTENFIQAFARDVFMEHLLLLDKTPGVDVLFSVHDESVNECDLHLTKQDIEEIMSFCPEWCKGVPVAAEAVEAPWYLK